MTEYIKYFVIIVQVYADDNRNKKVWTTYTQFVLTHIKQLNECLDKAMQ